MALADAPGGGSNWLTILAVIAALLIGTGVLMATLAYGFEHYFTYELDQARARSG